jgi:spermidine synthase
MRDHGAVDIEYETIDRDPTPLGVLELRRYRAPTGETGYEILLEGRFLMASHGSHSERAMAPLAHARLAEHMGLAVLVGGLGAGHTLRAVLDMPGVERVEVAEIGPKVAEWNRRYFAAANGGAVDDPRVKVVVGDVLDHIRRSPGRFDLLLLDVDNGPGWLAAAANAALYGRSGLRACRTALRRGGVIAIWSPQANPELASALATTFRWMNAVDTDAIGRDEGEPGSTIYLAGVASE